MKMKNYISILCVALTMMGVFTACTNEDSLMTEQTVAKTATIRATIDGDLGSRVALTDDAEKQVVKVDWAKGDAFKINVNGQNYTFTYNTATKKFECSDVNFPEYFNSDATITATYPATTPTEYVNQPGTLEGAAALLTMTATLDVEANQSTKNLALNFKHNNSIVKLTLRNDDFKGKDVTWVTLKSGNTVVATATNTFTGDATTGSIVAYFAVVPQAMSNISILATSDDDDDYTAKLTNKTLQAGKLYNVSKKLEFVERPAAFNIADAKAFGLAIRNNMGDLTKLRFVTKSDQTSNVTVTTDSKSIKAYAIPNGDWMEIHTSAKTFMLPNSCYQMFSGGNKFTEIDMSGLNTSNVTNMSMMFYYCSNLTSLNLSNLNTTNVTNMNQMFNNCSNLTTLTLGVNFNTENVTDMSSMFSGCSKLNSLNLSNFNTTKVTTMSTMFSGCSKLNSLDLRNFNTEDVTNMSSMFSSCSNLTSLDLSNFNTTKVTNMRSMFQKCSSLSTLTLSDNFNTENVTTMNYMFKNCNSLISLDLSSFNTEKVTAVYEMFSGCSSLDTLDLSNFNTTKVTNNQMNYMFQDCSSLTTLTLGVNFKTEQITEMLNIFSGCSSLDTLDLSSFNTEKVTNMSYMFQNCSSLRTLTLSNNFNTKNVTNMSTMFSGCSSLTTLDLSNFNTEKVTNMNYMFKNCNSLISLDLSNFNTEKVGYMQEMFSGCSSLRTLDLSSFQINNGTRIYYIFSYVGNRLTDSKTKIYVNADNKSSIENCCHASTEANVELEEKNKPTAST